MHKGLAGGLQILSFGWQAGGAVGSVSPPPCRSRGGSAVCGRLAVIWLARICRCGWGVWQGCALRTPRQLSSALTSPVVEV